MILYFDTETTGTNSFNHEILQIAGLVEVNGKIVEKFEFKSRPLKLSTIEPEALAVNGLNMDDILRYPDPSETFVKLMKIFEKYVDSRKKDKTSEDKFYPAGQNIDFDVKFLRSFFYQNNNKFFGAYFNYDYVDLRMMMSSLKAWGLVDLKDLKLSTIADFFFPGKKFDAHNAVADIEMTRDCILKYKEIYVNQQAVRNVITGQSDERPKTDKRKLVGKAKR